MFEKLRIIFSIPELRKKILLTVGLLAVYRIGFHIPLPMIDRIYASNERGVTFVFRASPQSFQLLGKNVLGDSSFASPIYADGKLFLRHAAFKNGVRQEFLVAISEKTQ